MLKTKQNQKNLFLFVKLILFSGVLYLLYARISVFDQSTWDSFTLDHLWALVLAVLLVVPNIWVAYQKWVLTSNTLKLETTEQIRIHSFFAGIVTGLLTPNMIGNFLGRFYYFKKEDRAMITALTIFSNIGQFLASITFGCVALVYFELNHMNEVGDLLYFLFLLIFLSYLGYYFIDRVVSLFRRFNFPGKLRAVLKENRWYRTQILLLSYSRFVIFTLQFSLILYAFGAQWNWELIAAIWKVYLITMLVPSLFLGKIGVKEYIALTVLAGFGLNEISILVASLIIWFVNTVSPAIVGLIVCRNKERFHVD